MISYVEEDKIYIENIDTANRNIIKYLSRTIKQITNVPFHEGSESEIQLYSHQIQLKGSLIQIIAILNPSSNLATWTVVSGKWNEHTKSNLIYKMINTCFPEIIPPLKEFYCVLLKNKIS